MQVSVGEEPFDSPDAQRLIAALDGELSQRYRPEQRFGPNLTSQHLDEGRGIFIVARADGRPVGCGAIRKLDERTAEVKRMYVDSALRGHGVGTRILRELEASATRMGIQRLVLETGIHQLQAIQLYRHAGFVPTPCWGEYAGVDTSVCYEKRLG